MPPENVHPIPTKIEPPEKAASSYEQHLREFFHSSEEDINSPTFDVILLGVGSDGHTASIFPGSPLLREKERWVSTVIAPSYALIPERITLTFPIINKANYAFFLVSGIKKKKIVRSILYNLNTAIKLYPAAMVHPRIKSVWFVDLKAANTIKK